MSTLNRIGKWHIFKGEFRVFIQSSLFLSVDSKKFEKQLLEVGANYKLSYLEKQDWKQETGVVSDLWKTDQEK